MCDYRLNAGLLTLLLSLTLFSPAWAGNTASSSVKPRLVATVTALTPQGLATIQTADGLVYEVFKGKTWRLGDTVECEQNEGTRISWQALDCRKAS